MSRNQAAARSMMMMLLVVALACSPGGASDDLPERLDRVTAVVLPYMTHMPFHIARAEGFFADEGLEVEFLRMGRSQEFMSALATGEVDVTTGMLAANELNLIASGARVRAVAAMAELAADGCTFVGLIGRAELLESGVMDSPEAIGGLVVDTDLTTPLGFLTDRFLASRGATIDDVALVNVPPPAALDALPSGAIDITIEAEPFVSQHLQRGASLLATGQELAPGYNQSVMLFGRRLLDERPELGERFARAVLRGVEQFAEGRTARNMEIVAQASGQLPEILERACWPLAPAGANLDTRGIRAYQAWAMQRGMLDRVLEDDELVDRRFFPGDSASTGEAR